MFSTVFKDHRRLIKISLSCLILFVLVTQIGWQRIVGSLKDVDLTFVAIAWGVALIGRWQEAFHMSLVLKGVETTLSTGRVFLAGSLSAFYGLFVPGDLLASYAKWADLSSATGKKSLTLSAMVYNRVTLILPWLLFGTLSLWFLNLFQGLLSGVILVSFVFLVVVIFFLFLTGNSYSSLMQFWNRYVSSRIPGLFRLKINFFLESLALLTRLPVGYHIKHLIHSGLIAVIFLFSFVLMTLAVPIIAPLFVLCAVRSLLTFVRLLPIAFSGLGIREGVLVLVLTQYGVEASDAFVLGLLMFTHSIMYATIGGVYQIYIISGTRQTPTKELP